jgi:hypothetical protein
MTRMRANLIPSILALVLVASCNSGSPDGKSSTTTTAPATSTTTSVPAFLEYTWQFDRPSDYTYSSEVVSLNDGGNLLAELKQLPADAFWTSVYKDPRVLHGPEYHACALDPDKNIVAVGECANFQTFIWESELMIGKYGQNGQLLAGWPKFYAGTGYSWNEGQNVVVDAEGNITVSGYVISTSRIFYMAIWRFDANGNMLPGWPQYPVGNHAFGTGVIQDANGDIVCCGGYGPTGYDNLVLVKYRPNGVIVSGWPRTYQVAAGQLTFGNNLIQDSDGNLVVVGYTQPMFGNNLIQDSDSTLVVAGDAQPTWSANDAVLYKLDKDGNVLSGWPKVWDSGEGYDEFFSISQDSNGDYCLVGRCSGLTETLGTSGSDGRPLDTRYGKDGTQLTTSGWPRIYDHATYRSDSLDVWKGFVDTSGNIAAAFTCESDRHVRTVKYGRDSALFTGFPKIWDKAGYVDDTRGSAVDDLDNIYVVGYSDPYDPLVDDDTTFLIKYPPASYSTGRPSIIAKQGTSYTSLGGFSEKLGDGSSGIVTYQLSADGTTWSYHDGTKWQKATSKFQANTAAEVNSRIDKFPQDVGLGSLFIKIFLVSTGEQKVRLSSVTVKYKY